MGYLFSCFVGDIYFSCIITETVEVFVMQREIEDHVMEDSANDTVSEFEHNHNIILESFMQDLEVCEKLHETADTLLKADEATVQVSIGSDALNEPISSKTQPTVELKQATSSTNAFDLEPLTENTGLDWFPLSSHISEFLYESSSDVHGSKRTFEETDIGRELTLDDPNNDDLINEVIDRSTTNFTNDFIPHFWEESQQSCVSRNVTEENVGDITSQKNSFARTSRSTTIGHSGLGDSAARPIASTSGPCPEHVYTENSPQKFVENISVPDISVTKAFCDKLTSGWLSDSHGQNISKSNYIPEVSQNSFKSLKNSDIQRSEGTDVARREERLQGLKGRQYGVKQMSIKAWLTQTNKKPERELDSANESELSTGDELPDLDIEETEQSPNCNPVTSEEEVESVHEETSCPSYFYNFPLTKYVNATSDIGLGLVMKQVSEAESSWPTDQTITSTNIQIQPADSTQSSKRKLRSSESKHTDYSKKFKGKSIL